MIGEPSNTTLQPAAKDGHLSLVDTLIDFDYHVDTADADGCTALFYAVQYEHRDIIELC
jgi:ankyrin repeat protein